MTRSLPFQGFWFSNENEKQGNVDARPVTAGCNGDTSHAATCEGVCVEESIDGEVPIWEHDQRNDQWLEWLAKVQLDGPANPFSSVLAHKFSFLFIVLFNSYPI